MAIDMLVTKWDEGKQMENAELVTLSKNLCDMCRALINQSTLDVTVEKDGVDYLPFDVRALAFITQSYDRLDRFLSEVK